MRTENVIVNEFEKGLKEEDGLFENTIPDDLPDNDHREIGHEQENDDGDGRAAGLESDAIKIYLKEIRKTPLLTFEQEQELGKRVSARIHAVIGITVPVEILPLGGIARSEGKAKRVIDERGK